ncbi:MAG: sigma-70 family RNA polymerase sigma factor [Thermoleophilia bacterium]|nr:sigma-70 family RNA polymerase sigma factor [Thermoleophilia bacterium]
MTRDAEARFDALWHDHHGEVMRYLVRRQPEMAGDLCAEVFAVAWRRIRDVPAQPVPWLLGIARNVLRNHLRGERRRKRLVVRLGQEPPGVSPEPLATGLDPRLAVALRGLSARDRELVALLAWEELTPGEAAAVLGTTRGAIAVRLHRIKTRLAGNGDPAIDETATTEGRP